MAVLRIDERGEADAKVERLDNRDRPLEQRHFLPLERARERGDRHGVAGTQGLRTQDGCHVRIVSGLSISVHRCVDPSRRPVTTGPCEGDGSMKRTMLGLAVLALAFSAPVGVSAGRGESVDPALMQPPLNATFGPWGMLAHRYGDHLRRTSDAHRRRCRNVPRLRRPAGLHERGRHAERCAAMATRMASP